MECSLDPSFPFRVIKALHFVLFINLAFVVLQLIVGLAFTFYPELGYNTFNQETALIRYPGFFGDAQFQGQYLAMGSFLFLIRPFPTTRPRLLFNMIILMALVYALLLAGSRAAFTGFCIGLLFLFVIAWRQFWKYAVIFIGGLVFYLSLSPRDGVFGRSHEIKSDLQFRQKMWDKAIAISISHPFLGIGAGNYRPYTEKHVRDQYIEKNGEIIYYDHPENGYLKLLVEYGTTGFFLIGLFILLPLYKALQCYRQRRFGHNALFLIASVTSWMVAFYTVYTLSDYRILVMLTTVLVLLIRFQQPEKLTHEAA